MRVKTLGLRSCKPMNMEKHLESVLHTGYENIKTAFQIMVSYGCVRRCTVFVHINLNWNELHIEIRSRNNQNRLLYNSYDFISRYKYIPACTWFLCMCLHNHFHKPKVTLGLIITASHCLQYRFKCTMSMHFIAL